ncbi:hypothetical protein SMMN14_07761 [Sphaerulina musiva]
MDQTDSNKRLKTSSGTPISTAAPASGAAGLPAYHPPAAARTIGGRDSGSSGHRHGMCKRVEASNEGTWRRQ